MPDDGATDSLWPVWLQDPRVQWALEWADHVRQWNENSLYGLELAGPLSDHMSAVAFAVVHEHQASAALLIKHGLLGSATALMRPAFEAFVRGIWLQWADDQELAHFQKGHDTATPDKIIRKVVKRSGVQRYADLLDRGGGSSASCPRRPWGRIRKRGCRRPVSRGRSWWSATNPMQGITLDYGHYLAKN